MNNIKIGFTNGHIISVSFGEKEVLLDIHIAREEKIADGHHFYKLDSYTFPMSIM